MISVEGLNIVFGDQVLLEDVDWHLGDNERVGLVGANGTGKSTFLRVLAGWSEPASGRVARSGRDSVGYLPQESQHLHGRSVWSTVLEGRQDILELEEETRRCERQLETAEGAELERRLAHYARLQEQFEEIGGYRLEAETRQVLAGLGFPAERWDDGCETFSGGWQLRISLARLLLQQPAHLLLDEPTNYLDLENIAWMEKYVRGYPGAVVVVSHDRHFLDSVVMRMCEIDQQQLFDYPGNYSRYLELREKRLELLRSRVKNQDQKVKSMQSFIDRSRANASKAALVQSRVKQMAKMDRLELPQDRKAVRIRFPAPQRSGKRVLDVSNLTWRYGDKPPVFEGLNLQLHRGDRMVLTGLNGAGKSTLMRLVCGQLEPRQGHVKIGHNVQLRYFAQDYTETLHPDATVLESVEGAASTDWRPRVRDLLGAFLFPGDDVFKKVKVLSGGEKSRLNLARILVGPANFLVLDEPTNHLDIATKQILLEALSQWEGTILFVSHDRYFIEHLSTSVAELASGQLTVYPWSFRDHQWMKDEVTG